MLKVITGQNNKWYHRINAKSLRYNALQCSWCFQTFWPSNRICV